MLVRSLYDLDYRIGIAKEWAGIDESRPWGGIAIPTRNGPATKAEIKLINFSYPLEELDQRVQELAGKLTLIPLTQLMAMALIVNQTYDNMGLQGTQTLGPTLDAAMRNTPEGRDFVRLAKKRVSKPLLSSAMPLSGITARRLWKNNPGKEAMNEYVWGLRIQKKQSTGIHNQTYGKLLASDSLRHSTARGRMLLHLNKFIDVLKNIADPIAIAF